MLAHSGTRFTAVLQRSLRLSLSSNSSKQAAASCTPISNPSLTCTTTLADSEQLGRREERRGAPPVLVTAGVGQCSILENGRQVDSFLQKQQHVRKHAFSSVSASNNAAPADVLSATPISISSGAEAPPAINVKRAAAIAKSVETDATRANVVSGAHSGQLAAPDTSATTSVHIACGGLRPVLDASRNVYGRVEEGTIAPSESNAGRHEATRSVQGSKRKSGKPADYIDLADIKAHTFHKSLPRFIEAIREADFVGFDLEFTGVRSAQWRQPMELDTRDTIYANRKHSAESFLVIQVGLCPFVWDATSGHFKVSPFNFHIFPRIKSSWAFSTAPSFFCEAASVKFLASQKIHLSDAVEQGIPYLSVAQEEAYRDTLLHRKLPDSPQFDDSDVQLLSPGDTSVIETNIKQVMQWQELAAEAGRAGEKFKQERFLVRELKLYQRRVLIEAVHRLFPTVVAVTKHPQADTVELGAGSEEAVRCHVEFIHTADRAEKDALVAQITAQILEAAEEDLNKTVGFKRVIDELAKGPAFLVGHNCLLDLLHLQDKFGTGLPPELPAFCTALHAKFPLIFDTKHIIHSHASTAPWSAAYSALLGALRKTRDHDVPVVKAEGFQSLPQLPTAGQLSGNGQKSGGLDAFATGLLFAQLAKSRGVQPGELRSLMQHLKAPQQPLVIRPEGRSILREVLKRAEERAAEERGIDGAEDKPIVESSEGDAKETPLRAFAKAANWVCAGAIRNARVSYNVAQQGWLRACQAELDPGVRPRLGPRRPNVLFLWDFPAEVTDGQMLDAVRNLLGDEGTKGSTKHYHAVRIDCQAALILFPKWSLAREFWERAGARPGRLAGGSLEAVLETEKGWQYKAKVDTFETYLALCESGVSAKDVRQAAAWSGLDPQHTFRKGYLAVQSRLWGDRQDKRPGFVENGDASGEEQPTKRPFGGTQKGNSTSDKNEQQSKRLYGVTHKDKSSLQTEEQPPKRAYGVIQKDPSFL